MITFTILLWIALNVIACNNGTVLEYLTIIGCIGIALCIVLEGLKPLRTKDYHKTIEKLEAEHPIEFGRRGVWYFCVIYFLLVIFIPQYSSNDAVASDLKFKESIPMLQQELNIGITDEMAKITFVLPKDLKVSLIALANESQYLFEYSEVLDNLPEEEQHMKTQLAQEAIDAAMVRREQIDKVMNNLKYKVILFCIMLVFQCFLSILDSYLTKKERLSGNGGLDNESTHSNWIC